MRPESDFNFYSELPELSDLLGLLDQSAFQSAPNDWSVLVTDVENSTQAIEQGLYKEVNILGAPTIIAVSNACNGASFPFVFGGDGATCLIPNSKVQHVGSVLATLRNHALLQMSLKLCIGFVPVSTIREKGADIKVAKQSLPAGFKLAHFTGGSLALADKLVKKQIDIYGLPPQKSHQQIDLAGLECRWNDVPSANGQIMTLIVRPKKFNLNELKPLLDLLNRLMPLSNPVRTDNLPITWPPQHLGAELALKIENSWYRWWRKKCLLGWTWLLSKITASTVNDPNSTAGKHFRAVGINADHLKFDDCLRTVLDVNEGESKELEALLLQLYSEGKLNYGIHYSDRALMTCFVHSLEKHIHLIDGADGGYAYAAKRLI
ncbi:DUF3095 family protein [Polynucleobacter necessarius]|uniref:DUF3095 family protein n=1 Tax=Polynucleobacter necessarius TaxID=576610 RepID=UPI0013B05BF8|nr:DUF3095 family protein [Polynucleobacter necessarius]